MVLQTEPRRRGGGATRHGRCGEIIPAIWRTLAVPALIVAGREDGVRTPEDAKIIHRGIEGSKLVVIDDAGHLMNMEQPEVFNDAMLDFLRTSQYRER